MPETIKYTKKDFESDQEVRWCPGCGDYAILNAALQVFARLGVPREKFVVVSGIGCSSRMPYYVNTYGFHSIHGRAMAVATGVKVANPELQVWVATGDGDALSIGGNHFLHTIRKNVGLKILLYNNEIYGLTKGQYSPTSQRGFVNKTAPFGTVENPVNACSLAISLGCSFVARVPDIYNKQLQDILYRAAFHKGTAFIEIIQNCPVFNDGVFDDFTAREVRDDKNIFLEHGKPILFGKDKTRGVVLKGTHLEVVENSQGKDIVVHDERSSNPLIEFALSRFRPPEQPMVFGVFRAVEAPTFEEQVNGQVEMARQKYGGEGSIEKLLNAGDTWFVK